MSTDTFTDLGVPTSLVKILEKQGITTPTPIQAASLPDSLDGADVLGRGRTGSGKTLAFLLPLVAGLDQSGYEARARKPRGLVLAPTRELAIQIDGALAPLAAELGLTSRTIFGGVGQNPQVQALRKGVDIVVACPGRLEDLMGQGHVDLSDVEITILDEADHMADLGFLPGVTRILRATPSDGQRMLFSATLDAGVKGLVDKFLHEPAVHEADSEQSPVSTMEHHVLHVREDDHQDVLTELVAGSERTVVFTRTKHRAKRLARKLNASGVPAVELHGNLAQNARTRNLDAFHAGTATALVATDIAARGIHVDHVGLVIHADPPVEHKAYLHRSGRTARAGEDGTVITMMTETQVRDVRDLLRKAGIKATTTRVKPGDAFLDQIVPGERAYPGAWESPEAPQQQRSARSGGGRSGGQRSGGRSGGGRSGESRGSSSRSGEGHEGRSSQGSPRAAGGATPEKGAAPSGQRRGGAHGGRPAGTSTARAPQRPARGGEGAGRGTAAPAQGAPRGRRGGGPRRAARPASNPNN